MKFSVVSQEGYAWFNHGFMVLSLVYGLITFDNPGIFGLVIQPGDYDLTEKNGNSNHTQTRIHAHNADGTKQKGA